MASAARIDRALLSIQRRRLAEQLGWVSLGLFVLPIGLVSAAPLLGMSAALLGRVFDAFMLCASAFWVIALGVRFLRGAEEGAIAVDGDHLVLERGGRERRIPLAQVTEGWLSPLRGEVEICTQDGDVLCARVAQIEEAQELLEAAGLDASRRTMRMQLGATASADLVTWLVGPGVALYGTVWLARQLPRPLAYNVALLAGLFYVLLQAVRALWGPTELLVGTDGLIIRQGLSRRFLPYASMTKIAIDCDSVTFHLTDRTIFPVRARYLDDAEIEQLRTRLEAAIATWEAGSSDAAVLSRLDRNGRSPEAWREAVMALVVRPEGYRTTAVTREQILQVLADPAAPAERRLGAAMALSAGADAENRAKIRVAAEACANQRVRVALDKVAKGELDDAAIEEAIADDEARRAAR